jgi:ADP-heptose:LPS heptosyltransferase
MPGAEFGPAKRWPTENYAKIAQKLVQTGNQVLILGSPKDFATADEIEQKALEYAQLDPYPDKHNAAPCREVFVGLVLVCHLINHNAFPQENLCV